MMETIKEDPEREKKEDGHPLLLKQVLTRLFTYLNVPELQTARLVCQEWKEWATPFLQDKSVVKLKGTCHICNSEWTTTRKGDQMDLNSGAHCHARTISFYRFVNRLSILPVRERERIFFRNFSISQMNLYLMGNVNTEATKYFQQFARLFGRKVFELELDQVQMCPTDSICQIMAMFPNLDKLRLIDTNIWADPLRSKKGKKNTNNSPGNIPLFPETSNGFLKSLCITKRWLSEELLPWSNIFYQCPHLEELKLENVGAAEMDECLTVLAALRLEAPERLKLKCLVIFPEVRLEEELSADALTMIDNGTIEPVADGVEILTWKLVGKVLSLSKIQELCVHVGYDDHQRAYLQEILTGLEKSPSVSSCTKLALHRSSRVFVSENQLIFKWKPHEPALSKIFKFPHIRQLEIAHNFVDTLDELIAIFPSVTSFTLNIVPVQFVSLSHKPYHSYLRTNLLLLLKEMSIGVVWPKVEKLTWNVVEARNPLTGKRTVIYKTTAIRHVPAIFPNVTVLTMSVTRSSDLQVIFDNMPQLLELNLLNNSFHRLKDEDLLGRSNGERLPEGAIRGIRQLKLLRRLCLDNNNSALTNLSIIDALVHLRNLRSIHISYARKLTLRGLRLLGVCPYLVYVTVSHLKHEQDDELDEIVMTTLMHQMLVKEALRRKAIMDKLELTHPKLVPVKPKKSRIPTRIDGRDSLIMSPDIEEDKEEVPLKPLEVDLTIEREIPIILTDPQSKVPESLTLRALLTHSGIRRKDILRNGLSPQQDMELKRRILTMTDHELALQELEALWKKREEGSKMEEKRKKGVKISGDRYEMGPKYYKIGGKRFDIIRTMYKLNGRTYHLVRRVYESDGETGRFLEKAKEQQQQQQEKKGKKKGEDEHKENNKEDEEKTRKGGNVSGGESESEYERSVKDEEEEEDELEEYCELSEDEEDDNLLELSGASDDPCVTDEEDSVQIYFDDPMYEGDKEFYDSSPPPQEELEEDEEEEDDEEVQNEAEVEEKFQNGKRHPRKDEILSESSESVRTDEFRRGGARPHRKTIVVTKRRKRLRFVEKTTLIEPPSTAESGIQEQTRPKTRSADYLKRPQVIDSRRVVSNPEFYTVHESRRRRSSTIFHNNIDSPETESIESQRLTILEIRREIFYDSLRAKDKGMKDGSDRTNQEEWQELTAEEIDADEDEEGEEEGEEEEDDEDIEEDEEEDEEEEEDDEEETVGGGYLSKTDFEARLAAADKQYGERTSQRVQSDDQEGTNPEGNLHRHHRRYSQPPRHEVMSYESEVN